MNICDNFCYEVLSEETRTCVIVGYEGDSAGTLCIPRWLNDYCVDEIGTAAFANSLFENIEIADGVSIICDRAFSYCENLTTVSLGNGVTSIGANAFLNCSSLTSITIPDSVTSIGFSAFSKCSSLTSITIPDGVTSIADRAFDDCSSLEKIIVHGKLDFIVTSSFKDTGFYNNKSNWTHNNQKGILILRGSNKIKYLLDINSDIMTENTTVDLSQLDVRLIASGCLDINEHNFLEDCKEIILPRSLNRLLTGAVNLIKETT